MGQLSHHIFVMDGESSKLERAGTDVHARSAEDPIITVNAGGRTMQTRRSTLTWSSRFFANIFNGSFQTTSADEELFLDCCPDIFANHVLYFFRHRKLRPDVPIAQVEDIANLYSIDVLLEETRRLRAEQHLLGTWCYHWLKEAIEQKDWFTIYKKDDKLWLYGVGEKDVDVDDVDDQVDDRVEYRHAELKQNTDFHYAQSESIGSWRFEVAGDKLLFESIAGIHDPSLMVPQILAYRKTNI